MNTSWWRSKIKDSYHALIKKAINEKNIRVAKQILTDFYQPYTTDFIYYLINVYPNKPFVTELICQILADSPPDYVLFKPHQFKELVSHITKHCTPSKMPSYLLETYDSNAPWQYLNEQCSGIELLLNVYPEIFNDYSLSKKLIECIPTGNLKLDSIIFENCESSFTNHYISECEKDYSEEDVIHFEDIPNQYHNAILLNHKKFKIAISRLKHLEHRRYIWYKNVSSIIFYATHHQEYAKHLIDQFDYLIDFLTDYKTNHITGIDIANDLLGDIEEEIQDIQELAQKTK